MGYSVVGGALGASASLWTVARVNDEKPADSSLTSKIGIAIKRVGFGTIILGETALGILAGRNHERQRCVADERLLGGQGQHCYMRENGRYSRKSALLAAAAVALGFTLVKLGNKILNCKN